LNWTEENNAGTTIILTEIVNSQVPNPWPFQLPAHMDEWFFGCDIFEMFRYGHT